MGEGREAAIVIVAIVQEVGVGVKSNIVRGRNQRRRVLKNEAKGRNVLERWNGGSVEYQKSECRFLLSSIEVDVYKYDSRLRAVDSKLNRICIRCRWISLIAPRFIILIVQFNAVLCLCRR